MTVSILENGVCGIDSLRQFLLETEQLFVPPLSSRVDIKEYSRKLLSEGYVFVCGDSKLGTFEAALAIYCQPHEFERAFIPFVASTSPGKGLGGQLLDAAIEHCKAAGSKGIDTQTWEGNATSKALFESRGFVVKGEADNRSGKTKSLLLGLTFRE